MTVYESRVMKAMGWSVNVPVTARTIPNSVMSTLSASGASVSVEAATLAMARPARVRALILDMQKYAIQRKLMSLKTNPLTVESF